eukprot:CAMPEP_0184669890 /NCGR_PEP_ID=MMETSP0308-20130426/79543_1 /TAXON_ID=38269 /ORGANISM="Gloeochaete witrockiana, Strain SAG 46.84" /LENGTH=43 /DNA_ID= /DNA_START= /DNA_END= /DNA_ORIENTATION=
MARGFEPSSNAGLALPVRKSGKRFRANQVEVYSDKENEHGNTT